MRVSPNCGETCIYRNLSEEYEREVGHLSEATEVLWVRGRSGDANAHPSQFTSAGDTGIAVLLHSVQVYPVIEKEQSRRRRGGC